MFRAAAGRRESEAGDRINHVLEADPRALVTARMNYTLHKFAQSCIVRVLAVKYCQLRLTY